MGTTTDTNKGSTAMERHIAFLESRGEAISDADYHRLLKIYLVKEISNPNI